MSLASNAKGVSLNAEMPKDAVGAGVNEEEAEVTSVVVSNAVPTDANAEASGT
jgi:hypothetical protein